MATRVSSAQRTPSIEELVESLTAESRRARQKAAADLCSTYGDKPELLLPFGRQLVDALDLEEGRTRWECLDMLSALIPLAPALCREALPGVENALFDEESGPLHLSAMRFLCKFAAYSPEFSVLAWPLLDEAIQCLHGDPEFVDMLNALVTLSSAPLDDAVREAFKERMSFDATFNKGLTQRKSKLIVDNLSK